MENYGNNKKTVRGKLNVFYSALFYSVQSYSVLFHFFLLYSHSFLTILPSSSVTELLSIRYYNAGLFCLQVSSQNLKEI